VGNPGISEGHFPRSRSGLVFRSYVLRTLETTRLAVLADALEDAGCDNAEILDHCHQPSEHVRGCWVLDLVLGKK
jgi:hypothetical protein